MARDARQNRHDLRAIAHQAMLDRNLQPDFSKAALAEAGSLTGPAERPDPSIQDLKDLPWVSIDNDDSLDLDQLSVAEKTPDGTRVLVAIADVDALVRKADAIDDHARTNTTSVYTAAEIFPMLPPRLSTDLSSLGQDEDRLAIVIEMTVRADASIASSGVYRARVRNHAKLAYNGVAAWLENEGPPPARLATQAELRDQIHLQDEAAQRLRTVRHERGALSLQTIEARAVFQDGTLSDLAVEEKNRAKELIEDLMIAANGVTVRFLQAAGLPALRRVLREPERWERIVLLATDLGETLPETPDCGALEGFLERRRKADPLRFPDLSLTVVKLMGRGEYEVASPRGTPPGHFGLAVQDYTHSTAPNRRYPDLITQRLIKAALAKRRAPYDETELNGLAHHCTEQEDNANKVERLVRKAAAALLLEHRIGERFDGIVTGASEKGTYVRILRPPIEGRVVEGSAGMDVGEKVRVKLLGTNVEKGWIDFGSA